MYPDQSSREVNKYKCLLLVVTASTQKMVSLFATIPECWCIQMNAKRRFRNQIQLKRGTEPWPRLCKLRTIKVKRKSQRHQSKVLKPDKMTWQPFFFHNSIIVLWFLFGYFCPSNVMINVKNVPKFSIFVTFHGNLRFSTFTEYYCEDIAWLLIVIVHLSCSAPLTSESWFLKTLLSLISGWRHSNNTSNSSNSKSNNSSCSDRFLMSRTCWRLSANQEPTLRFNDQSECQVLTSGSEKPIRSQHCGSLTNQILSCGPPINRARSRFPQLLPLTDAGYSATH